MKKEILYKGKRKDNGEWVEGVPIESNIHYLYGTFMYVHFTIKKTMSLNSGGGHFGSCVEIIKETVSEFTNRYDADINGEPVFENDIIENCDTKQLQLVYWSDEKAAWYCEYLDGSGRTVSLSDSLGNLNKKVGNIFDNSDLIK